MRLLPDLGQTAPVRTLPGAQAFLRQPLMRRLRLGLDAAAVRDVVVPAARRRWDRPWAQKADEHDGRGSTRQRRKGGPAPEDAFLAGLLERLRPPAAALLRSVRWPKPLYPYQDRGVGFLYDRQAALLADDMGLGKTVQALAALSLLLSSRQVAEALIVAPASLATHWSREIARWLPQLAGAHTIVRGAPAERRRLWRAPTPLKVVGYETLRADYEAGRIPPFAFGVVVLDEAQRIKNAETGLAAACNALRRERSWALTGTPLENRIDDLVSILEWVSGQRWSQLPSAPALRARQRDLQLRRRKEDVLTHLPPKTVVDVAVDLSPDQRSSYRQLEQMGRVELRDLGALVTVTHVLALITRLKQVCNFDPATGCSAKLEFVHERLAEIIENGRKALVFSQFTDASVGIRRLRAELGERAVGMFHGGMSPRQKETALQAFKQGDVPVLALSLRAGGLGLNLQEASYVFHFDRWWNPAVERQAEDRAHRLGQSLPVTVYRLTTPGTIEERIAALLRQKETLFAEVVDGAPLPAPGISVRELFALLDLEPPATLHSEEGNTGKE